ncbi:uncharacterized protein LOC123468115 [Daphnia magna]|uniref:uncharacterized protein LOC123468115 n=1 Tax=Daphnia magna TaxID=35525 RepID=UPI001E1BB191|nr:uncharacterized protein LOC123468115 [Daphnia magna]
MIYPVNDDEQQNAPVAPNRNVAFAIENDSQVNNDATGRHNLETNFESNPKIDQVALAKRRKLDLEFLLQQKKVQIEREHMDLETKSRREQEDILFQIQKEEQLLAFLQPVATASSNLCSTPIETRQNNFFAGVSSVNAPFPVLTPLAPNVTEVCIPLSSRTQPIFAPSSTYAPSHRWPKLVVAKFDGDPHGWTKYARNINATLGETSMPDSLKLLALQESLMEVIQRRMAHVFTGSRAFQAAWAEIESKYGNPGLIIQAHNQHLQQLTPFKTGDFSGLFDMATAVRDAVSSVSPENCIMFTSVIGSLPAKMPMHLLTDWGKLAYSLKRMPTIIDFDRWIDTVVGAEELRGAKLTLNSNQAVKTPAANYTRNNIQSAGSSNYNNRGPTILAGSLLPNTATECPACHEKAGHRLESCNTFTRMLVNTRATLCATNNRCFKCLIRGHYATKCRKPYNGCSECGGPQPSPASRCRPPIPSCFIKASIGPVLLAIVRVIVEAGNRSRTVFAVLDPGSEATLVTRSLADRLNLKGYPTKIHFGSFASSTLLDTSVVSFRLRSAESKHSFALDEAFVVSNINLSHRKINWPKMKYGWPHLACLQLPAIDSTKVELLIGMDLPSAHQTLRVITPLANEDGPSAHETCFGYAVVGKIPRSLVSGPSLKIDVNLGSTEVEPSLATTVERFQSNQSFGVVVKSKSKKSQEEEDQQMLNVIKRSIKFVGCGYEIELPIRPEVSVVPNNRSQALSRFFGVERRLVEPTVRDVASNYEKIMQNLISSGTVIAVCQSDLCEPQGKIWYLPHFFVVNPTKPQKIRVVFDAKARFCSTSYNSIMLRGPPSIPSLVGVLLRARQFRVALSADITAFYHRIGVASQHQPLQRFVYRRFGSKEPILTYQFTTLIFGAVFSSSAAVYTLQHAASECAAFPQVAAKMPDNFYSDNLIDSFETEDEAIKFSMAVRQSLEAGGFSLTAFASSAPRVLESIPLHQRSASVLDLNVDALPVEYHLGIELDLTTDSYSVRVKTMPQVSTRREMLAAMSLTFDPLGICLPVIAGAKLLFQLTNRLERNARGWDQPLPADLLEKWNVWADGLAKLSFPNVSRCFRPADLPFFGLCISADRVC